MKVAHSEAPHIQCNGPSTVPLPYIHEKKTSLLGLDMSPGPLMISLMPFKRAGTCSTFLVHVCMWVSTLNSILNFINTLFVTKIEKLLVTRKI